MLEAAPPATAAAGRERESKQKNSSTIDQAPIIPYRKRERLGDLERRAHVQAQQLSRHQRRGALGAVPEDLEKDVALDLHGAERAVSGGGRGGRRERERGCCGHGVFVSFTRSMCVRRSRISVQRKRGRGGRDTALVRRVLFLSFLLKFEKKEKK